MSIFKMKPYFSEKIWGYEKWNLSTHKAGSSIIEENGELLSDYLKSDLPILIKIIKSEQSLSVQVHPEDKFANKYENDNGKTECWYILDAKEDAELVCGIKPGLDKEKMERVIKNNKIEDYLEFISVKPGDMIYIPAGTVHAIGPGIKLIEVQQSSDVTYRLYDWGRKRELHIEKSVQVINYEGDNGYGKIENFEVLETPYFKVQKVKVDGLLQGKTQDKFCSFTVIRGNGYVVSYDKRIELNPEETVYIEPNTKYEIIGEMELIKA